MLQKGMQEKSSIRSGNTAESKIERIFDLPSAPDA